MSDKSKRNRAPATRWCLPVVAAKEPAVCFSAVRAKLSSCHAFVRRWYTLVLLLLVALCLHADQNLAAPNLSAIAEDFELDAEEKDSKLGGQVQLGFFFVGGITSVAMGPLADKRNRVNLLFVVVILGSVPCALIQHVPSGRTGFSWYFCSRVFTGISVGGSFPLLYSLCGDLCTADQRALISAAMGVATAIGVASGQLISGFLGPSYGWRIPFVVVAYPAIFFALVLWVTVSDPRTQRKVSGEATELVAVGQSIEGGASSSTEAYSIEALTEQQPTKEVHERSTSSLPQGERKSFTEFNEPESTAAMDEHGSLTDCSRFGLVFRGPTNRLLLGQACPSCVAWSTVTTFIPDYLHKEQGLTVQSATLLVSCFGLSCLAWALLGAAIGQRIYNRQKGHLAYLMACCTAFAVGPFWLLINSSKEDLQSHSFEGSEDSSPLPSAWACVIAILGGAAAVANPNVKGLLMNVNTSATRGTVFALVTLTDDVGKGLGPEVVSLGISVLGRRLALSCAVGCWFMSSAFLWMTNFTIAKDVHRIERLEKREEFAI
mmetsp:Transcript_77511/g.136719  ORF Transcript_77511/g.136719 Transcript_77511/m.136719 type:complete len:547 (-) Transcript_77511:80-1720(-)